MRKVLSTKALLGAALALSLIWLGWLWRGGDADADPIDVAPPEDLAEPITGTPSWPAPGDETGPITPFAPPAPGDVPIEALTAREQATVEAGLVLGLDGAAASAAVHAGFATASAQAAARAHAEAAANALGLEGLGDVGVTP